MMAGVDGLFDETTAVLATPDGVLVVDLGGRTTHNLLNSNYDGALLLLG